MKNLIIYSIFFLSILTFTSCEKVIKFNGKVTDPLIVVNSFITPDSVVSAQISESKFFLSNVDSFTMINNATVTLNVNGIMKGNLLYTSNGLYTSSYHPAIGDSIQLFVQVPGKNTISCGTTTQAPVNIIKIDTTSVLTGTTSPLISVNKTSGKNDTIGTIINRTLKFVLRFQDMPDIQNYYRLVVYTKTTKNGKSTLNFTMSFDDIVSGNTNKDAVGPPTSTTTNKYNVFSDDLLNGTEYPLTFSIPNNINVYNNGYHSSSTQKEVIVNLQNISRSYYLYLQTLATIKTNTFFAEPVQVYSNVDGGIGILGSYTSNILKIKL